MGTWAPPLSRTRPVEIVDHDVKCGEEGVHVEHGESVPFPSGSGSRPTLDRGHLPLKSSIDNPHQAFKERGYWEDYQRAFEGAINETSTEYAPWYVIPANKKWYRNLVIARAIADTLEAMDLQLSRPRKAWTG